MKTVIKGGQWARIAKPARDGGAPYAAWAMTMVGEVGIYAEVWRPEPRRHHWEVFGSEGQTLVKGFASSTRNAKKEARKAARRWWREAPR